jgi:sugar phosphate isomerase/epimerase
VDYVETVAKLDCRDLGIALEPISRFECYPLWSLRSDPQLRRDLLTALQRCDVSVSIGEGFIAWPDKDICDAASDMDLLCELGAPCMNLVSIDSERNRAFDQCAAFADMARSRGVKATVEFMPGMLIGNLGVAMEVVRYVGRDNFGVLVDAMHFFRSGSDLTQLASLERAAIGYVQLCDVPSNGQGSYGDEARFERRCPGKGDLPLRDFLKALPSDALIGLEVPMLSAAEAGVEPLGRLRPCVSATRELLG